MIYAESISEAALISTVCLNHVHTLQLRFKGGLSPAFPVPLQQNVQVVWLLAVFGWLFFFPWKPLEAEFLNVDIPGMILQLVFSEWV